MVLQRYVSTELTHFVGRSERDEDTQYRVLVTVLRSGLLTPRPDNPQEGNMSEVHTGGKLSDESMFLGRVTCFCDIPLADLEIHMNKYSRFGIAFDKRWLVSRGANPVYYIVADPGLPRPISVQRAMEELRRQLHDAGQAEVAMGEVVSKLQIFDEVLPIHHKLFRKIRGVAETEQGGISIREVAAVEGFHDTHVGIFLKPFSANLADDDPDNVYMEREWRILGNLQFNLSDVVRVILPKRYGKRLREDVPQYFAQVHFPDDS